MASQKESDSDWNKKRQQAQPFINRIRSVLEKKTQGFWADRVSEKMPEREVVTERFKGEVAYEHGEDRLWWKITGTQQEEGAEKNNWRFVC